MELELPNSATDLTSAELIFKTARSVAESDPIRSALTFRPLLKITCNALEPLTT